MNQLKIKGAIAGAPASGIVQLINHAGNVVYNADGIPAEGIDMIGLPSGVYLVKISHTNGSLTTRKIVKQ